MIKTTTEQVIDRPAADVWAYAADIVRHAEWMGVSDARLVRGTGSDIGSRGRERLALGPFKWDVEFEVAEAVSGRRIVWRSMTGAPFDIEISLDLDSVGPTSTKATYGAAIQPHGLWRLLSSLLAAEGKSGPERELRRLKRQSRRSASWDTPSVARDDPPTQPLHASLISRWPLAGSPTSLIPLLLGGSPLRNGLPVVEAGVVATASASSSPWRGGLRETRCGRIGSVPRRSSTASASSITSRRAGAPDGMTDSPLVPRAALPRRDGVGGVAARKM